MIKKALFFGIWIGLIVYAFGFAPPNQPNTFELIQRLSTGDWDGINPIVVALFNLMGVWPLVYSCVLIADGRLQRIAAWPFVLTSFGVGAFALLPYLGLRQPNPEFSGIKDRFIQVLDSRITGIILTLIAVGIAGYGLLGANWSDFVTQWQSDRFIHVMSLDFCLLALLFPTILKDDMAKRDMTSAALFWGVTLIPLFGPLFYLCVRSPLISTPSNSVNQSSSIVVET
ncbi:MAG: DUF2834 domain-containing protein [Microcoleaceae cyanobacterium]